MSQNIMWMDVNPEKGDAYSKIVNYEKYDDYIFLFDIDKTLYKMSAEFFKVEMGIWLNVYNKLKINKPNVPSFEDILASDKLYGGGFFKVFDITYQEAEELRGVFPYENYISENKELNALLEGVPYKKWCFTNGVRSKAERILDILNLTNLDGAICSPDDGKGDIGKPYQHAYLFVENVLSIKDKSKVIFFDDSDYNIQMGEECGWTCYKVNPDDNIVDLVKQALVDIQKKRTNVCNKS